MGVGGAKDISIWSKNNALCSIIIFTFCTQIIAIVVMYLLGGFGEMLPNNLYMVQIAFQKFYKC